MCPCDTVPVAGPGSGELERAGQRGKGTGPDRVGPGSHGERFCLYLRGCEPLPGPQPQRETVWLTHWKDSWRRTVALSRPIKQAVSLIQGRDNDR